MTELVASAIAGDESAFAPSHRTDWSAREPSANENFNLPEILET